MGKGSENGDKMIDIHMHLIPGVDDGAADMEMALSMALRAMDQGVTAIIATPHSAAFDGDPQRTVEQFNRLRAGLSRLLPVYLGCEVYCAPERMRTVTEALKTGRYPRMNGTSYVLTEFSPWVTEEDALVCAAALLRDGWKPVLAHVERYERLRSSVTALRAMGCLMQINAYSLYDEEDAAIRTFAQRLALDRVADVLGTDAHRTYHRPPSVRMGLKWLYENCAADYADSLSWWEAARLFEIREDSDGGI